MTAPATAPRNAPQFFLTCFTGPDQGKRVALADGAILFGRALDCNLLSDDPDVAERHASFWLDGGRLSVLALDHAPTFVDGHPVTESGVLEPGQQLRLGRSVWRIVAPSRGADIEGLGDLVNRLGERISSVAGVEKVEGFSARTMFSEVFKRRTDEECEVYFNVGTPTTTPLLTQVDASWPKPWAFFRIFTLSALVYGLLLFALDYFENPKLIPALIVMGSMAIPLAILVFFFEVNVLRNVSLYQIIRLLVAGGVLSILISLIGFRMSGLSAWLGAMSAGIVEETGKALTLLLVVNRRKYRWTLNGLLLGATVGTGFAVFETAGYALDPLLGGIAAGSPAMGLQVMRDTLVLRALLSVFGGHALFTGLVGAALWRVRKDNDFRPEMLLDPKFLRVFGLCVAMHMLWNSPIELPFYGKQIAIGFVAWTVLLAFIQDGLKQVRRAQLGDTMQTMPAVAVARAAATG